MATRTLEELAAAASNARQICEQLRAEGFVATAIQELSLQAAYDEAAACEQEYLDELHRREAAKGRQVVTGEELVATADDVRSAVSRCEGLLNDLATLSAQDFARSRLELALGEVRRLLGQAKPVSEEKERLGYRLAALEEDYELVSGRRDDPAELANVIESAYRDNVVDELWLAEQKAALESVDVPCERRQAPLTRCTLSR
jgi:hypothetical protein